MSNSGREDSGPVQSVDRAAAILEILARDGEAGVTEVARELGVHKSTASRLLAALDRRELVTQDTARGRFRLGVGIVRLAGAAARRLDLVQRARRSPGAGPGGRRDGQHRHPVGPRRALPGPGGGPGGAVTAQLAGQRIPLHATSDGKVLLAYLSPAEIAGYLMPLVQRFTDHTITTGPRWPGPWPR